LVLIGDTQKMLIPLTLLAIESSSVIAMRAMKLMAGDAAAVQEASLMIGEKVDAAFEATASLIAGASGDQIINRYRQHAAVNAKRLGKRQSTSADRSIIRP
jgi:hypothetical protein